ncbi:MAG: aminoglycoside 3'-phosphotransferase [Oscillospiraceae bacterium]|nr:aminoglycoside 3'-phosphotransferase [Oscillospiraceae bacterium]
MADDADNHEFLCKLIGSMCEELPERKREMREKIKAEKMLPESIRRIVEGRSYVPDHTGKSGSEIRIFDDMVLKIVPNGAEIEDTVRMMKWLEGKIPAPRVIACERDDGYCYLLMSRVKGRMSCDRSYLEHPKELLTILADALKMLWSVDIADCPCMRDPDSELKAAGYRVEHGLVDLDTFGEGGFEDPKALLEWLTANKPDHEPVLSHGDFCLPNIIIEDGKISGFIDLGDSGVGDKWRDIALCYRSLKQNFDGTYGGKVYPDFDPDMLFEALGTEPDRDKLNYYLLLDELF